MLPDLGRNLTPTDVGRRLLDLDQIWRTSGNRWPASAQFGRICAEARLPEQLLDSFCVRSPPGPLWRGFDQVLRGFVPKVCGNHQLCTGFGQEFRGFGQI